MSEHSLEEEIEEELLGATTLDKMVEDEDDTWMQTVITVTPEEDGVLRELSPRTTVSAAPDTPLVTDDIVYRRPFISTEEFILPPEEVTEEVIEEVTAEVTEEIETVTEARDAQNQTYLQGIPAVRIPVECKDEASQTIYMSSPCPPLKYFRDIMTSMNDVPMPDPKKTIKITTITIFDFDTPYDIVIDDLNAIIDEETLNGFFLFEEEETDTYVNDTLEFVLTRAFWISDPTCQKQENGVDQEAQTYLRYNWRLRTLVMDKDAQTRLTCEPKKSNSNLLSGYQDIRQSVRSLLEDCVDKGIDSSTVAHEITEEIIDRCAEMVKYPMKDGSVQTVATYTLPCEREEDVLRKLRIGVVVDPSEALIIIEPLINDMLDSICRIVSRDASIVVKWILSSVVQRTEKIITKLVEIRMEVQPKSLEEVLDERRKKIHELISKKSTESMSTQTFLAAVHEVTKIKDPQNLLCTLCKKKSPCYWCQRDPEEDLPPQETKPNRTQDILFAYKPCYVIATPSESRKYSFLPHTCTSEDKLKSTPKSLRKDSKGSVNVVFKCLKNATSGDSCASWSQVVDTALTKPWSMSECATSTCKIAAFPVEKEHTLQSPKCRHPPLQTQQALRILKDTFCTRGTCTGSLRTSREVDCTYAGIENTYERRGMCPRSDLQHVVTTCQTSKNMFCYCYHCESKRHINHCTNCGACSRCALSDSDF